MMAGDVSELGGPLAKVEQIVGDLEFERVDLAVVFPPLSEAVTRLEANDTILLQRGAHERAICHRLAVYLEQEVNLRKAVDGRWHVDCEYNLYGSGHGRARSVEEMRKIIVVQGRQDSDGEESEHSVFPDIVVHRRDTTENQLVVEVKVVRGFPDRREIEFDLRKLAAFQDAGKGFEYGNALFLVVCSGSSLSCEDLGGWEVGTFALRRAVD